MLLPALLTEFAATVAHDRGTTVDLLIQIAEIEKRGLYLGQACADIYAYCIDVLHMSASTAWRRTRSARESRQFPVILPMIADGKLHLSAVSLLAAHLKPDNAASMLAEATHKSKAEVELILARRFPKPDVPESVRELAAESTAASATAQVVANIAAQISPVTVVPTDSSEFAKSEGPLFVSDDSRDETRDESSDRSRDESRKVRQVVSQVVAAAAAKYGAGAVPQAMLADIANDVAQPIVNAAAAVAPAPVVPGEAPAKVTPRSAGRFAWQLTADQEVQDLLEQAQDLIGRAGTKDLAQVLKRGLQLLVDTLRKAKYATTSQPRETPINANGRHVPRAVVRAVSERDGCQCTFVGPDGRRCTQRSGLQFDHRIPFARGGRTTVDNLRQLCGPHNQYEAERVLGEEHMRQQQTASRASAVQAQAARAEAAVRARGKKVPEQRSADGGGAGEQSQGAP